ncbi:TPA: hypothetical protein ACGFUW_002625 [Flavobacterium psychrophilum]|uniref:hypothetical protein n=1 Tax=Flavobacterium psychrophilum TaxID=96345 RepID=UPI002C2B0A0A|nr:hypothetical protein [Flavobacterium psychrophilum]
MKYISILILFFLVTPNYMFGQEKNKNISFILVIDDEIVSTSVEITFYLNSENSTEKVSATYYPGTLSMSKSDYEKIISTETKSIYLKYFGTIYTNGKQNYYDFEIEYNKIWLADTYNILRFYNLDKKKYKKLYEPLSKQKNYTFELSSPNNTFLRIRKR